MSNVVPNDMDWNDPLRRREVAMQLLLSDPNISAREKAYMLTALELVKAMEEFRPISDKKDDKPAWPPRHTGDILNNDDDECSGNCSCNDNY